MKRSAKIFSWILLGLVITHPDSLSADEWMTWASTYTHDPVQGRPIDQYAPPVEPVAQPRADFTRSGYRHYRSTLQAGLSSDNIHIVEQWGRQVIPYEQWRFPYRPYAVPYDAWGPQWPQTLFNGGFRGQGFGGPGYGGPGYGGPGYGRGWRGSVPPGGFPPGGVPPGTPPPGSVPPGTPPVGTGTVNNGQPPPGVASPLTPQPGYWPLQPQYLNQPWYDGNHPPQPPLDPRTDGQFFYKPPRTR